MAIQQNINQLLGTASIAAGLYAHQPNVQKARAEKIELKNIIERQAAIEAREAQVVDFIESPEYDAAVEGLTEKQTESLLEAKFGPEPTEEIAKLRERRMELDPEYYEAELAKSKKGFETSAALKRAINERRVVEQAKAEAKAEQEKHRIQMEKNKEEAREAYEREQERSRKFKEMILSGTPSEWRLR